MNKSKQWLLGKLKKENMIVIALFGILLMVIALPAEKKKDGNLRTKSVQTDGKSDILKTETDRGDSESRLEERLEQFLSCMDGVGKAKVMLTYASAPEQIVEKDVPSSSSSTSEKDAVGGNRNIVTEEKEEGTVYTTDIAGNRIPYVRQVLPARVEGVTVLCEGGAHPVVQQNITDVMKALFGIEAHKIKVAKMVKEE